MLATQGSNFLILLFHVLLMSAYGQIDTSVCKPYENNIVPGDIPEIAKEFQVRIQLNKPESTLTKEILMLYDKFDNKAELIADENDNGDDQLTRQVYLYSTDELFTIQAGNQRSCEISKISTMNANEAFFGNKMTMPKDIFHLDTDKFAFKKIGKTNWRGIPVNHFKSCQTWAKLNATVDMDFYFKDPKFIQGVSFQDNDISIPIATIVDGLVMGRHVHLEYNFFQYRANVEKKYQAFEQPEGYYCENQSRKEPLPQIPSAFSISVERIVIRENNKGLSDFVKFTYSAGAQIIRYDVTKKDEFKNEINEYKIIHDYNSGVSYTIKKDEGTCEIGSIKDDPNSLNKGKDLGAYISLKNPQEIFFLDDTYFYVGVRVERGIPCDVFASKRTDFQGDGITGKEFLFEQYFMRVVEASDIGIDQREDVVPVALKITPLENNPNGDKYVSHFYDFDSKMDTAEPFDFAECFLADQKKEFAIEFKFPGDLSPTNFDKAYKTTLIENFYLSIMFDIAIYEFSIFRIIPPQIKTLNDGFVLYSGVLDRPPAIKHFTKTGENVKCDIMKAANRLASPSAEACAEICLDSSIATVGIDCYSFDFSSELKLCAFYGPSHSSDEHVITDSSVKTCDHYSETVNGTDNVNKEAIYDLLEDLVARSLFNITIYGEAGVTLALFNAVDMYPASYDADPSQIQDSKTLFLNEFVLNDLTAEFNETEIARNKELMLRKKRSVRTLDECARLCVSEKSFMCESFTYSLENECKWSSVSGKDIDNQYFSANNYTSLYYYDFLHNYEKFANKTDSATSANFVNVKTPSDCAKLCSDNKSNCQSFNLCNLNNQLKCFVSNNHVSSSKANNHDIVFSPICDHYSKKTLLDFQIVPETQMSCDPQSSYVNISVELCAQLCIESEDFLCRSFDFISNNSTECLLYNENLRDKDKKGIKPIDNSVSTHYSRTQIEGSQLEARINVRHTHKYGGGAIFFIALVIGIVCVAASAGATFFAKKYLGQKADLPSMEFINPNY